MSFLLIFVLPAHPDNPDHLQQSAGATCPFSNRLAGPDDPGHLQQIAVVNRPVCKRPADPDDPDPLQQINVSNRPPSKRPVDPDDPTKICNNRKIIRRLNLNFVMQLSNFLLSQLLMSGVKICTVKDIFTSAAHSSGIFFIEPAL